MPDPDWAIDALRRLGLSDGGERVSTLPGGVSNDVVAVSVGTNAYVVKRALPRLRVAETWEASPERAMTEAAAIRWAGELQPERVPRIVAVDPAAFVVVETRAPDDYTDWKSQLLDGDLRPQIAEALGDGLARWHRASVGDPKVAAFDDPRAFGQLRISPYYEAIAALHRDIAPVVMEQVERMAVTRRSLVHGDFSPKNMLVGAEGLWVIDWEVAHLGDPVFDVAFLVGHLACKSVARPEHAEGFRGLADRFLASYRDAAADDPLGVADLGYLGRHVACLVLARVDGKSPVEYFTESDRDRARAAALAALRRPADHPDALWELL